MAFDVVDGTPGFVSYLNNRTQVTDLGNNQSKAELQITMHMKPLMGALLEDLKIYAETGKPSAQKQARMKKLASKAA